MGKSKELAELGQVVTQDGGNVLVGTTTNPDSRKFRVYGPTEFDGAGVSLITHKSSGTEIGSAGQGNYVVSGGPADGYGITSATSLVFGSGGYTERMRIDASGRVTISYQPSFNAYKNDGHVSSGPVIFNGVNHNQGGHYSTSTGLFTAPVSGRYLISVMLMCIDGVTYNNSYYTFRVNGTTIKNVYSSNGGPYHHMFNHVEVINLSSGDTVGVSAANFTIYGTSAYYTTFSGHLLG